MEVCSHGVCALFGRCLTYYQVSTRLIRWKWNYDQEYKLMKKWNEEW